ncbi:MAG: ADP-dependent glucokinase/phosphofructokinase, partial [Methanosarcinaceae archaeon]|nr:ADP-dependent glucokinase/phosphofructokinase [Methanosarcinaceae archaeon]
NFGKVKVQEFLEAFEGKPFQKGAFAHFGDYTLCMLPTLLCKTPVSTVGLGDTFTASFFLRRLELHVQA